jgi:hypothetical protein
MVFVENLHLESWLEEVEILQIFVLPFLSLVEDHHLFLDVSFNHDRDSWKASSVIILISKQLLNKQSYRNLSGFVDCRIKR